MNKLVAILAAGFSSIAFANEVNVQTFLPKASLDYTLSESGRPLGADDDSKARLFFSGTYNALNDPLVVLNQNRTRRLDTTIDGIRTFDLVTGAEWNGRASLNAALPVHSVHQEGGLRESALGDLRVFPKIYLGSRNSPTNVALIPEASFATGKRGLFVTDPGFGYGLLAAVEHDWSWIKGAFNTGYRGNSQAVEGELDYRRKLLLSASASKPLGPKWAVNLEATRTFTLPFNSTQNPSELQAGALWRFNPDWVAAFGASFGTTNKVSSANHRFLVSLRFSPTLGGVALYTRSEARVLLPELAILEKDEIIASSSSAVLTRNAINLDREVAFQHDSSVLLPSAKRVLKDVALLILRDIQHISGIRIEGHTNELGPDLYNLKLSQRRASSVESFLVAQGVDHEILHSQGFGKRQPKPDSEKLPRAQRLAVNRRVEFKVDRPLGDEHGPH